jgi:hypothetical protein
MAGDDRGVDCKLCGLALALVPRQLLCDGCYRKFLVLNWRTDYPDREPPQYLFDAELREAGWAELVRCINEADDH